MTTTANGQGSRETGSISPPWLLVFGGVTRSGHRRARRMATRALSDGLNVVWFDGLEESDSDPAESEPSSPDGRSNLHMVPFAAALSRSVSGRLRSGGPLRTFAPGRQVWRLLRKAGGVLQPRACWLTVRPDVRALAGLTAPVGIVYTDDQSITSAWYASRIWPTAPVSTDLIAERQ